MCQSTLQQAAKLCDCKKISLLNRLLTGLITRLMFLAGLPGVQHHLGLGTRAKGIQGDADRMQGGNT